MEYVQYVTKPIRSFHPFKHKVSSYIRNETLSKQPAFKKR